ncbi:MAG: hypothetical protein VCA18_08465 [Opitutales bacterium]
MVLWRVRVPSLPPPQGYSRPTLTALTRPVRCACSMGLWVFELCEKKPPSCIIRVVGCRQVELFEDTCPELGRPAPLVPELMYIRMKK